MNEAFGRIWVFVCFVLFWGPLGLVAAQRAACEGAAWVLRVGTV